MRIEIGLSTSWTSPNNDLTLTLMFIDSIILLSPHLDRTLGQLICPVWKMKASKKKKKKMWRGKNEGCGESQRVSFIRGGRYYEHIYPKLENNEERLKPSQYFRCSKWTTSPVVDNGPQRVPDTIMCLKWESDNVKASLQDRGRETWIRSTCAHPLLYILCSSAKTRDKRPLS